MASCAVVQEVASGIRDCFREKVDLSGHGMTMEDRASAYVSSAFDPLCMKSYMIMHVVEAGVYYFCRGGGDSAASSLRGK